MEKRDFFISYTKADKAEAEWIADTLTNNGFSVYIQARDIMPGDVFVKRMEDFLENSRSFIAVWSKNYSKSEFAMWEFHAAFVAQRQRRIKLFLPVCVDDSSLPLLYAALVHVNLMGLDNAEKGNRLINAVNQDGKQQAFNVKKKDEPMRDSEISANSDTSERRKNQKMEFVLTELQLLLLNYQKCILYIDIILFSILAFILVFPNTRSKLYIVAGESRYVQNDYVNAREYFEKAAALGNSEGINNLGTLYFYGYGVDQDYTKALVYYEEAAALGNSTSMNNIGILYEFGLGVDQDFAKSAKYYQQSIDMDENKIAEENLARLQSKISS